MIDISLLKQIELELRSGNTHLSKDILNELTELSPWNLKIVNDFIIRVKSSLDKPFIDFIYKKYEDAEFRPIKNKLPEKDLLICQLKRTQNDYFLTDAYNRLVIPSELSKHDFFTVFGYDVVTARNICIEQALKNNFKYVLFIDDDILAPNNALMRLWESHKKYDTYVSSAIYSKKVKPLSIPFSNSTEGEIPVDGKVHFSDLLIGLGFCLINVKELTKSMPLPLFWSFVDQNGIWTLGEDAFFIQSLMEYTSKPAVVDTSINCLHLDKKYKIFYGNKESDTQYASNIWELIPERFFKNRIPPRFPILLVCTPTRTPDEPIVYDLKSLQFDRSFNNQFFNVHSKPVDDARNLCVLEALNRDAEFILFIDNDILPQKNDIPAKLINDFYYIKNNIDPNVIAVSADYPLKSEIKESAHLNIDLSDNIVKSISRIKFDSNYVKSNWLVASGCVLIHTDIFKQARFPYYKCYSKDNNGELVNEDAHFTELCIHNGYNLYINTDLKCSHVDFKSNKIYNL